MLTSLVRNNPTPAGVHGVGVDQDPPPGASIRPSWVKPGLPPFPGRCGPRRSRPSTRITSFALSTYLQVGLHWMPLTCGADTAVPGQVRRATDQPQEFRWTGGGRPARRYPAPPAPAASPESVFSARGHTHPRHHRVVARPVVVVPLDRGVRTTVVVRRNRTARSGRDPEDMSVGRRGLVICSLGSMPFTEHRTHIADADDGGTARSASRPRARGGCRLTDSPGTAP